MLYESNIFMDVEFSRQAHFEDTDKKVITLNIRMIPKKTEYKDIYVVWALLQTILVANQPMLLSNYSCNDSKN